jgi:hypothetical protein
MFKVFFGWWRIHLDEDFGRDIRHDDVYEDLASTAQCKNNKKNALPQTPARFDKGYFMLLSCMPAAQFCKYHQTCGDLGGTIMPITWMKRKHLHSFVETTKSVVNLQPQFEPAPL